MLMHGMLIRWRELSFALQKNIGNGLRSGMHSAKYQNNQKNSFHDQSHLNRVY
jgi:hypothetical protein